MRDCVVDMQKVEIVKFRDFSHASGKGQIVGWIVKQRIAGNFHLVVVDVGVGLQTNGLSVRDEVDLMSSLRQFQSEFGGDHAAAAVGGIARDPNLHSEAPPSGP